MEIRKSVTDLWTDGQTGVGAKDAFAYKNKRPYLKNSTQVSNGILLLGDFFTLQLFKLSLMIFSISCDNAVRNDNQ